MSNQKDEQHRGQVAFYVSLENQTFQFCPIEHRPKINVLHHSQLLIHWASRDLWQQLLDEHSHLNKHVQFSVVFPNQTKIDIYKKKKTKYL